MYTVINTFLFVSPLLYFGAYVPLAGLTYVLTEMNDLGASGVVRKKNSVQVIFGPRVITIAAKVKAVLGVD